MASTRIYTVHINPEIAQPYQEPVFLPEGFNWAAFVFGPLWALYHRLWWPAGVLFAVGVLLETFQIALNLQPLSVSILQLGAQAILGYVANDLLRAHYQRQGFITADIVASDTKLHASQRFLERILAQSKAPA